MLLNYDENVGIVTIVAKEPNAENNSMALATNFMLNMQIYGDFFDRLRLPMGLVNKTRPIFVGGWG